MIKKIKKEQLLIGALFGILCLVIMLPIPGENKTEKNMTENKQAGEMSVETMEEQLRDILQTISGVGRVEIFITYADHGKLIVEKDESISEEKIQEMDGNGGTRTTTTVQSEKHTVCEEGDIPYIVQELSPVVEGILVVAEGAGNVSVKKQIQETMEALFGLDAHKISIMKMEVSR